MVTLAGAPPPPRKMAVRPTVAAVLFSVLCSAVFLVHYWIYGTSIFHINSVGSSSLLPLNVEYERFRSLLLAPPMWTRLYGAGQPLAVGSSSFNPAMLLVSWLTPFEHAVIGYEILMRGAGILGCYALARRNHVGPGAALIAGALFGFNVLSSSSGQDPQIGLSVLVLPWSLVALQNLVERPSWQSSLLLSATLALFYLISSTQIFGFTIFMLTLPAFLALWFDGMTRAASVAGALVRPLAFLALAAVAALSVVGFDLAQQVQNLLLGLKTMDASMAARDAYTLVPLIAVITIVLSLLSRAKSRWPRSIGAGMMIAGYASIFHVVGLKFSTVLTSDFTRIPPESFIFEDQPSRFLYSLLGVVFALRGVWAMSADGARHQRLLPILCVGAAFGLAPWLLTPSSYFARFIFIPLIGYSLLAALGADAAFDDVAARLSVRARAVVISLLVGLVTAEAANIDFRQTLFTDALKYTRVDSPEMKFLADLPRGARVIDEYENEHTVWLRHVPLERRALPRWLFPAYAGTETFSRVGVSFVPDYFQAYYDRALHGAYFGTKPGEWSPLLNIAAVSYLISRSTPPEGLLPAFSGPDYSIWRNPAALPRVQVYHRAVAAPDGTALEQLETSASAGPPSAAFLPPEEAQKAAALDPNASAVAELEDGRDEYVRLRVRASGPSLLVIADTYHPGWLAYVDGRAIPVLRANVAFQGVIVGEGDHQVELRFAPKYHSLLLALAALGLALHIVAGLMVLRRRAA